jgi:hypothetical protein
MPDVSAHYVTEFTVFFVAPPVVLGVVLVVMGVLGFVWAYKWIASLGSGAGGN